MAGGHLGQRIPSDGLETTEALAILDSVFSAIESAHRRGVVHGRIRPENVLFDGEGNAYVADLGVDEICAGVATFATNAYDRAREARRCSGNAGCRRVLPRGPDPPGARWFSTAFGRTVAAR